MTVHHRQLVAQLPLADLPAAQVQRCRAVLQTLADLADDAGVAFPSQASLAVAAGMTTPSLRRALTLLELGGWLALRRGPREVTFYELRLDPPPKRPPWRRCLAAGHQPETAREQHKRRPIDLTSRTSTHPGGRR